MAVQWYIEEQNNKLNERALYGPFPQDELITRLNDRFADFMAGILANLFVIPMTDKQANMFYVNPPEFWYNRLAEYTNDTT